MFSTLLVAVFVAGNVSAQAGKLQPVELLEVRFLLGDDPSWSHPELDDSGWSRSPLAAVPVDHAVQWIRGEIELGAVPAPGSGDRLGISLSMLGSWELYWDGIFLARGGQVGSDKATESPGPVDSQVLLPAELATPGRHLVALRCSTFGRIPAPWHSRLWVGEYGSLEQWHRTADLRILLTVPALLLVAIWAGTLWILDRQDTSSLALAGLVTTVATLPLLVAWRGFPGFTWNLAFPRLVLFQLSIWLCGLLLLVYVHRRFDCGRSSSIGYLVYLGFSLPMLPLTYGLAGDEMAYVALSWPFRVSLLWVLFLALWGLKSGRWALALLGLPVLFTLWLLFESYPVAHHPMIFGTYTLTIMILWTHAGESRRLRRQRREADARSARLEVELVRRQLQPHFLMNTLTALSEWLDADPPTAREMIRALDQELRSLGIMSAR
ncbi:MAG: histidine kinase, partial [Holophagales bacterium]|nr:histidine kinase [Holophagales bacterium]